MVETPRNTWSPVYNWNIAENRRKTQPNNLIFLAKPGLYMTHHQDAGSKKQNPRSVIKCIKLQYPTILLYHIALLVCLEIPEYNRRNNVTSMFLHRNVSWEDRKYNIVQLRLTLFIQDYLLSWLSSSVAAASTPIIDVIKYSWTLEILFWASVIIG